MIAKSNDKFVTHNMKWGNTDLISTRFCRRISISLYGSTLGGSKRVGDWYDLRLHRLLGSLEVAEKALRTVASHLLPQGYSSCKRHSW